MVKMAAVPVVLNSSFCFLTRKFGKIASKPLKSMLFDFYDVDKLCDAKHQLMMDTRNMNLYVSLPHIPERRNGESKAIRVVDDIFTVLAFLDENLMINKLPRYVAGSPDAMPSVRLYEGDLAYLKKKLERLQNEVKDLYIAMATIMKSMEHRPGSRPCTQPAQPVVNSYSDTDGEARVQLSNSVAADRVNIMTSRDSHHNDGTVS